MAAEGVVALWHSGRASRAHRRVLAYERWALAVRRMPGAGGRRLREPLGALIHLTSESPFVCLKYRARCSRDRVEYALDWGHQTPGLHSSLRVPIHVQKHCEPKDE